MPKNSILNKLIVTFIIIAVLPLGIVVYFVDKNFKTTVFKVTKKQKKWAKEIYNQHEI